MSDERRLEQIEQQLGAIRDVSSERSTQLLSMVKDIQFQVGLLAQKMDYAHEDSKDFKVRLNDMFKSAQDAAASTRASFSRAFKRIERVELLLGAAMILGIIGSVSGSELLAMVSKIFGK